MKARLVWLIVCGIWSSTWLFIKVGLEEIPPFAFAAARFILASIALLTWAKIRRIPWPKGSAWKLITAVGALQFTLNYALVYWGEQYISSGLAAVLQSMFPAFGMVIAHFYLPDERLKPIKILGVLLGIAGVAVIFSDQPTLRGPPAPLGKLALVLSAFFGSYSNVLIKTYGRALDPMMMAACAMAIGSVPLTALAFAFEGNPWMISWSLRAIGALLYLVIVGSVLAFALYYWLIRTMEVTQTMLISLVIPVVATLLGAVILHERIHGRLIAGTLCILTGLIIAMFHKTMIAALKPKSG